MTGVPYIRVEVVKMMQQDNLLCSDCCHYLITIMIPFEDFECDDASRSGINVNDLGELFLIALGATFNILSVLVPMISLIIGLVFNSRRFTLSRGADSRSRSRGSRGGQCSRCSGLVSSLHLRLELVLHH